MSANLDAMKASLKAVPPAELLASAAAAAKLRAGAPGAPPVDKELARELEERAEQAKGWGLEWLEDFLARNFPLPDWLYLDLVQVKTTCVIIAPPNAGKTLLALDLGAQIVVAALGKGATGPRAAIVEEEGAGGAFQQRLRRAFTAAGGVPLQAVKVAWNCGRDLSNPDDLEQLAADCKGTDLIVLDSLADLSDVDENDPKEMKRLGKALRRLQTLTGATVLALHHMTKEGWRPGERPTLRHLRGHGALAAKVDTVLALVPGDDDPDRVNFDLYCLKQRDGRKAEPRRVSVEMIGPAATVTMEPIEHQALREHPSKDVLDPEILQHVPFEGAGRPMSKAKLAAALHRNETDVSIAVDRMIDSGTLKVIGSWKLYRPPLPPPGGGSAESADPHARPPPAPLLLKRSGGGGGGKDGYE